MSRVWQEFYCNDCDGYILVKINMALDNHRVEVVCPSCGRKHPREVHKGQIMDVGGSGGSITREEICPTMSAFSKEPSTKFMTKHTRDGQIIDEEDLVGAGTKEEGKEGKSFISQLWHERFGGKK